MAQAGDRQYLGSSLQEGQPERLPDAQMPILRLTFHIRCLNHLGLRRGILGGGSPLSLGRKTRERSKRKLVVEPASMDESLAMLPTASDERSV